MITSGLLIVAAAPAAATDLTAGVIAERMSTDERVAYISGVVEGLAYARFLRDRPDETGMQCIYDWFYVEGNGGSWERIDAWFERHQDQTVGVLLHVLIKKECGE